MLAHQVYKAPKTGQKTASGYPRVYRNEEKSTDAVTPNFDATEVRRESKLYEYPVIKAIGRCFNFHKRSARLRQVERPIHPKDRGRAIRQPQNDPGAIRGVVDRDRSIVGAVAHPEGDPQKHERRYLEPLHVQVRRQVRNYQDQVTLSRSRSWPTRWRAERYMRNKWKESCWFNNPSSGGDQDDYDGDEKRRHKGTWPVLIMFYYQKLVSL